VNPEKACSDLIMHKSVVQGKSSFFAHDAFHANKLSVFDKMMQYEFDGEY